MYGEEKRQSILKGFGEFDTDLEKGGKMNTSHLVLKEVNIGGKTAHRWVNPNKDNQEYAQHGSDVEFQHKGQTIRGKVGSVLKTGEYHIKGEDGKNYAKHPHQFNSPHEQEKVQNFATRTPTENLKNFVKNPKSDPKLKEIAEKELKSRESGESKEPEAKEKKQKPDKEKPSKTKDKTPNKETVDEEAKQTGVSEKDAEEAEDGEGNINRRFKTFERFSRALAKGKTKSMIAYGSGGVGKTYTVTKELEAQGKKEFKDGMEVGSDDYDYVKITGKATPAAVYQALYEHNGKIILFDDCDSVLQHEDAVNLFKGALDTSGDGTIQYGTQRPLKDSNGNPMPNRFDFNGRVAFISNLPPEKVPQPLKSRSLRIDMTMTADQTIDRIKHIATDDKGQYQNLKFPGPDGKPVKYTHEDMESAINFLDKYKNKTNDLNVRTIGSILSIIHEAKEDGDDDWEDDAKAMVFSKALDDDLMKSLDYLIND